MQPVRVVLAKLGLDGHDRGVKVVARGLRDHGMEVIYLGMRITPEQLAEAALQEDADVVGVSILSGAHMRLLPKLVQQLKARGMNDVIVLAGGTIPESDVEALEQAGVHGVFRQGASVDDVAALIRERLELESAV
jgi:methylmalonyl-CoA mutase C-terminal domain/subunit